jgi:PAS domain S-box-containing protein
VRKIPHLSFTVCRPETLHRTRYAIDRLLPFCRVSLALSLLLLAVIATVGTMLFLVRRRSVTELALTQSVRELADVKYALDQSAIVARTDQRGIINYVNDKFCEISKYPREELLGQDHRILNSGYHPKEFMRELWTTIARGKIWRGEIRNRAKDGSIYWVDTTIVPFLNEQGRPYQYLAIRADITQRKRQEEELRRAESLARLGEMSAVVAHEVKNPLAGIGGAVEVIRGRMPEGQDREVLGEVLDRIKALNELLQELLVFARPVPPKVERVPVVAHLKQVAEQIRRDPALNRVEVEIKGDEVELSADAEQLRRLFLNLMLNGAQAMGRKGTLDVAVERSGAVCEVAVSDHGPGVPLDLREKVFEPFYTTKHRGTGLGLAIAARIVRDPDGQSRLEETPGGGATMRVTLPIGAGIPAPAGEIPRP